MSIGNAKKFITRAMVEQELRNRLNETASQTEAARVLSDEHLDFSAGEFEEAYNNLLTLCQFQEQADQLAEMRMWWELLLQFINTGHEQSVSLCGSAATCSSRGGCSGCH